jgi:hypothetical protein
LSIHPLELPSFRAAIQRTRAVGSSTCSEG